MVFEDYLKIIEGADTDTIRAYCGSVKMAQNALQEPLGRKNIRGWLSALSCRPQSKRRHLAGLKAYARYLAEEGDRGLLEDLSGFRGPKVRQIDLKPKRVVREEEWPKIQGVLTEAPKKGLLTFLWKTGARITEALSLPRENIQEGKAFVIGKGGKKRLVFFNGEVQDALNLLPQTDKIFPISPRTANRWCHDSAKSAGIESFSPHALRHGFKSALKNRGVDEEIIQILMGHVPGNVTRHYGEVMEAKLRKAVESLDTPLLGESL